MKIGKILGITETIIFGTAMVASTSFIAYALLKPEKQRENGFHLKSTKTSVSQVQKMKRFHFK